jgi:phosphotransferase system  glucose/maltose/N-acetylglucosamine-specific IIC component
MLHVLFKLLFWSGVIVFIYGLVAAPVAYVHHIRRGSRVMAAEALIAAILSTFCLVALWFIYDYFM